MPSFDYARYIYPPEALVWFRTVTLSPGQILDVERIVVRPYMRTMRLLGVYGDSQPMVDLMVFADKFQQVTRFLTGWKAQEALTFNIPFKRSLVLRLANRSANTLTFNLAYVVMVEGEEEELGVPEIESVIGGYASTSTNTMLFRQLAGDYILEVTQLYVEKTSGSGTLVITRDGIETKIDLDELPARPAYIPVSFKVKEEVYARLLPTAASEVAVRLKYRAYRKR